MKKTENRIDSGGAEHEPSAASYYDLKTEAVEELVTADVSNTPAYPREELDRYRSHRERRISSRVKLILIKLWFPGMVCFFFLWGLGSFLGTVIDQLFVLGLASGIVTDLLTNNLIRFLEKTPGEHSKWMMVPKKRTAGLFLNVLYAYWVLFFVWSVYQGINLAAAHITGRTDRVVLGVEPILFGILYFAFDELFIGMKHLSLRIVRDARKAVSRGNRGVS